MLLHELAQLLPPTCFLAACHPSSMALLQSLALSHCAAMFISLMPRVSLHHILYLELEAE